MSGLSRAGDAARRGVLRLVPPARRDWVEAVWAEASEVPPGWPRVAWRAGGVQLVVREALIRRGTSGAALFGTVAGLATWAAWPGAPASFATSVGQVDVIATVVLLVGLTVMARRVLGPPVRSRPARLLRVLTYLGILALIAAKNVVEQVLDVPPGGGTELRLYRLISGPGFGDHWKNEVVFLVVIALYATIILWVTSQRSRVAPATLAIGAVAGIALGLAWYVIGPLGFGGAPATNPWLPGSDSAPFIVLAVALLLVAPVAAMVAADRRHSATAGSACPPAARIRQILAAALLTGLTGALFVTVSGTGTIAAMLTAPWLRNWLYHGHLLSGVAGLRSLVLGNPAALTYSHQITAATDAPPFLIICIAFPLVALVLTGLGALAIELSVNGQANPPPGSGGGGGGGGPAGPAAVPDLPGGMELADCGRPGMVSP
jgi:hypothetical protein